MTGKEVLDAIRKYAVKNAHDYGEARVSSVLSKVLSEFPEMKSDIKDLAKEVGRVIGEVNSMDASSIDKEYSLHSSEFEREQAEKEVKGRPKLVIDGAEEGKVVTRFAPEPSGYMHVGHANAAFLARGIADAYEGKCLLYFDDTNPEKEKQEYVDAFKRDLSWLGIRFEREYYASDNIERMYGYGRQLISNGGAYVCTCTAELIKSNRFNGTACAHRKSSAGENLALFESMIRGEYEEGRAVVRFVGDMSSANTALRDPTLFRIKKQRHYRQGDRYCLWPGYDFNTPINDSTEGITDGLRTKEYELRAELYDAVLDSLGLRKPRMHMHARFSVKGQPRGKRDIRKLVSEGAVSGWDDPRLVTIPALRRRGIVPAAIKEFTLSVGRSMTSGMMSIDRLLAENRRLIDPIAKHLFYVHDPVRLSVGEASGAEARLRLHPGSDEYRTYRCDGSIYVSAEDSSAMSNGDTVRLKDFMDIRVTGTGDAITASKAEAAERSRVIQWVPGNGFLKCTVMIPGELVDGEGRLLKDSLRTENGYVEGYASKLALHDIVQFERFGYCILDSKEEMRFIFISK